MLFLTINFMIIHVILQSIIVLALVKKPYPFCLFLHLFSRFRGSHLSPLFCFLYRQLDWQFLNNISDPFSLLVLWKNVLDIELFRVLDLIFFFAFGARIVGTSIESLVGLSLSLGGSGRGWKDSKPLALEGIRGWNRFFIHSFHLFFI